jgi:glycogen operon protein
VHPEDPQHEPGSGKHRGNAGEGDTSSWRRWIDTALGSPQDIVPWQMAAVLPGPTYQAAAHSVVVLFGEIRRGNTLT